MRLLAASVVLVSCAQSSPPVATAVALPTTASASSSAASVPPPSSASAAPREATPAPSAAGSASPAAGGAFEGGACKSDSDCDGYVDCCAFRAECGTHAQARQQHDLCNCCMSCQAPTHPAAIVPCTCRAGRCAKR